VYLSLERQRAVDRLNSQKQNLTAIVERQTAELSEELQQSVRLERAYRETSEYYERIFDRMHSPIIITNTELYITRTNKAFEDTVGTPKTELIGRKILSIHPFDQLTAMEEGKTYVLEIPRDGGKNTRILCSFSEIHGEGTTTPAGFIATGLEIPEQET
jgi:PAS domain S-box-containing protein